MLFNKENLKAQINSRLQIVVQLLLQSLKQLRDPSRLVLMELCSLKSLNLLKMMISSRSTHSLKR